MSPGERVRAAYQRRAETDYIFESPGLNVFLTIITCGIWGFYLLYQLMRRDRDHNQRRLELLEAANAFAWEQASQQGLADELRPQFERVASQLEVLRRLTREFRDPVIWVVLAVFANSIAEIVAFIFIDQDLDTHDRAECAIEADLAAIYQRLGYTLPGADSGRVKGKHNYVGRIIATLASCGIYGLWWVYDMQVEGNRHLETNWVWDDALANVVAGTSPTA
jgi:hypothetical protein